MLRESVPFLAKFSPARDCSPVIKDRDYFLEKMDDLNLLDHVLLKKNLEKFFVCDGVIGGDGDCVDFALHYGLGIPKQSLTGLPVHDRRDLKSVNGFIQSLGFKMKHLARIPIHASLEVEPGVTRFAMILAMAKKRFDEAYEYVLCYSDFHVFTLKRRKISRRKRVVIFVDSFHPRSKELLSVFTKKALESIERSGGVVKLLCAIRR